MSEICRYINIIQAKLLELTFHIKNRFCSGASRDSGEIYTFLISNNSKMRGIFCLNITFACNRNTRKMHPLKSHNEEEI
jgi:hypothetical protein